MCGRCGEEGRIGNGAELYICRAQAETVTLPSPQQPHAAALLSGSEATYMLTTDTAIVSTDGEGSVQTCEWMQISHSL